MGRGEPSQVGYRHSRRPGSDLTKHPDSKVANGMADGATIKASQYVNAVVVMKVSH